MRPADIANDQTSEKSILVLGATGEIGYAVTNALGRTNHRTKVLVRHRRLHFATDLEVVEAPRFTVDVFADALNGVDTVIYSLGLPEQFARSENFFRNANHELFKTFLEALESSTVRRLIYVSTPEVFEVRDGVIREDHALADGAGLSDYFASKVTANQLAVSFAERTGTALTTIHPAAVYGGLQTSTGVTDFIENVVNRRRWKVPFIMPTKFGIVHADSLARAIIASLDQPGAFIVSDQMTSLSEIVHLLKTHHHTYRPPMVATAVAKRLVDASDWVARRLGFQPVMSSDQLTLLTRGSEPRADRARDLLDWQPRSLSEGLQDYLASTTTIAGSTPNEAVQDEPARQRSFA